MALTDSYISNTWFFTGDKGYLDDDGNLILKGRVRNEINKSGMKIMPEDIDMQLEKHPDVVEACAFPVDDEISGQDIGVAIVLIKNGDIDHVKKWLSDNISPSKYPSHWYKVNEIPKTDRGKVNRMNVAKVIHSYHNER